MCVGWIITVFFWAECHFRSQGLDSGSGGPLCYQRVLRPAPGWETYLGVSEGLAGGVVAFGVFVSLIYVVYVFTAGVDLYKSRRGRWGVEWILRGSGGGGGGGS